MARKHEQGKTLPRESALKQADGEETAGNEVMS